MTRTALPVAAFFAATITASTAFAGGMPVLNFPNLQFAPAASETVVTRDIAPQTSVCTLLELSVGLSQKDCGTLDRTDVAKLKTVQDD